MAERKERKQHVYGEVEKVWGSPVAEWTVNGELRLPGRTLPGSQASAVINAILSLLYRVDKSLFNYACMGIEAEIANLKRRQVAEAQQQPAPEVKPATFSDSLMGPKVEQKSSKKAS